MKNISSFVLFINKKHKEPFILLKRKGKGLFPLQACANGQKKVGDVIQKYNQEILNFEEQLLTGNPREIDLEVVFRLQNLNYELMERLNPGLVYDVLARGERTSRATEFIQQRGYIPEECASMLSIDFLKQGREELMMMEMEALKGGDAFKNFCRMSNTIQEAATRLGWRP